MDEAFETFFELHEDAEFSRARDDTFERIAHVVFLHERCALGDAGTFFTEDEFLLFGARGNDHDLDFRAHHLLELYENLFLVTVGHARVVCGGELRCRQESCEAVPVDDEPALVGIRDRELEDRLFLHRLLGFVPDDGLARFAQRQFDVALGVVHADDLRGHGVADVYILQRFACRKVFAAVDDTRAVRREVDEYTRAADGDHGAFDDVVYDGRRTGREHELRHGPLLRQGFGGQALLVRIVIFTSDNLLILLNFRVHFVLRLVPRFLRYRVCRKQGMNHPLYY